MQLDRGSDRQLGRMILRSTARLVGGRVARTVVTVVGVAVLARLLSPADFGVVAVASMILPLANALLEGLIDVPTMREDALDQEGLANLVWIGFTLMVGLCAVLWLTAPGLAALLSAPRLAEVLRVLSFGLMLQPFIAAGQAVLRRQHRFGLSALLMPLSGLAYVALAIALALLGFGMWSLIVGQLASLAVSALVLGLMAGIPLLPPRRLQTGVAWRLGGVGLSTRLFAWILANVDTLFASASLGATGAGIYSRAYNLTTQIKEPFSVLEQTIRPAFMAQRNLDDADAARATLRGLRLVVLAAALAASGVIVLREAVVSVLLGPKWDAVVMPLAILAASLPARVARLYLDGLTYARGSMRHMLARNISLSTLLAFGLLIWASEGILVIALMVAATHVVSTFFVGGPDDIAVGGTRVRRLSAMAPGYAAGAAIVGLAEIHPMLWPSTPQLMEWAIRLGIFGLVSLLVVAALPRGWLPRSWDARRRFLFR